MNYKQLFISLHLAGIMVFVTGAFMTGDLMRSKLLISFSIITTLNAIRLLSGKNAKTNQDYDKKTSIQTD